MKRDELLEEYRRHLEIDRNNLDEEVARLPSLYFTVSDHASQALASKDFLQHQFDSLEAALSEKYRREGERSAEKYTETRIKNKMQTDRKREKLAAKLRRASNSVRLWRALEQAFSQKSSSLRYLVEMHLKEVMQNAHIAKVVGSEAASAARTDQYRKRISKVRRKTARG